ncbi:hypothetical protein LPB41_21400 [Thalassospira sp. MA62]|nr:hypothetical protein [Thalassospira sp. MA62]
MWDIELSVYKYDAGVNLFISALILLIYLPYTFRKFQFFPLFVSAIFSVSVAVCFLFYGFSLKSFLFGVSIVIYFYSVYYSVLFCIEDNFKCLRSILLLFLLGQLFLQFYQVVDMILSNPGYDVSRYIWYIFTIFRASGFFSEASHVAISIVPLIFMKDSEGRHINPCSILASLSVILSISSTAVLGFLMLFTLLILKVNSWRRISIAVGLVVSAVGTVVIGWQVFELQSFAAFGERFWGVLQVFGGNVRVGTNLSALVFANGADMALSGLKDIIGSGLGNFRDYYPKSVSSSVIELMNNGNPLNADDGSSVVFKMIGEMGFIGLSIVLFFGLSGVSVIARYGDHIFSVLIGFMLIAAIRSAGYFHGPYILGFAVVGVLWQAGELWPRVPFKREIDLTTLLSCRRT